MRHAIFAFLGAALALLCAGQAWADEPPSSISADYAASVEILDPVPEPAGSQSSFLDHFHIKKKRGIAYTRTVSFGARDMSLSLQGPAMGKKKKGAVGLTFVVKF